ncbi:MAG TPA: AMP-binding protein, partial [Acidimicrobiales bacterium]|nr:AMP-binding protein [Acidimicrobiales bacterium]
MALSYEEAGAQVTAPGQIFEVAPVVIGGVEYRAFKHAPASLRDVFAGARGQGDKTFLVYEDERWSFAEVMRHVDALGAALVDRYGVERGDRVAIAMRNFPEWVVSFAAITSIGAVSVSLNAWWVEDELDYGLADSGAKVLIADGERVERTRTACERLGVKVIAVRSPVTDGADAWEHVLQLGAPLPEVAVGPEDDATILYTSGTTGRPKGAVSTNRAVVQSLMGFACRALVERAREQSARPENDTENETDNETENEPESGTDSGSAADLAEAAEQSFILVVPLFHVTGCIPVMMSCFAFGMKLVMMHRW